MTIPAFTRRQVHAALAATLVPSFASAANPGAAAGAEVARIAQDWYHGRLALFPLEATENTGDPRFEAAFEIDIAPAHRRRVREFCDGIARRLAAVDPDVLARDDRLTHDLLAYDVKDHADVLAYPDHLTPVGHGGGLPTRFAQWATGNGSQPLKTTANYEHFLARLERLPEWIDQAIANMREGMRQGIVQPRPLVERAIQQLDSILPADPMASAFLAKVRQFSPGVPQSDRPRLRAAYTAAVTRDVLPAVRRLRTFMSGVYLPASRTTSGIGALPGGDAWYRLLVRSSTTGDMTPDAIHELGLREVARIRGEMEAVKARFGFEGDLDAFFRSLDARPELTPFRDDEAVLGYIRAIDARVRAGLPKLFARAPKAPLEIRAVDEMLRDTASSYYVPPALDGSRPGVFFAAYTDARKLRTTQLTALFLHEGQPGHHYQIALQQETARTNFRRNFMPDAFVEGWGLYAESLGQALGVYDDPNALLGRLQMELHRALRLVVDTGLHAKGWSREQAIAFLRQKEGSDEDGARRAIERYMGWPGQALAYKVGELKIIELRERARAALGAKFDIRAFHSQVLEDGSLPLRMLESKIDRWIAAGRGRS